MWNIGPWEDETRQEDGGLAVVVTVKFIHRLGFGTMSGGRKIGGLGYWSSEQAGKE